MGRTIQEIEEDLTEHDGSWAWNQMLKGEIVQRCGGGFAVFRIVQNVVLCAPPRAPHSWEPSSFKEKDYWHSYQAKWEVVNE